MISSQNFESDPYTLIITKRQIFGSENESNLHKINKQHSLMNQEDNLSQENKHLNFIELIQSRSSMIPTVKVVSPENEQILQNEDGFYFQSSLHLNEGEFESNLAEGRIENNQLRCEVHVPTENQSRQTKDQAYEL